jgi:putative transposase
MYLPGIPAHIVQRGNNRNVCFFAKDDYLVYKEALAKGLKRYGGFLHAYCLMTNHVHLLITPADTDSISRVIQHVGRQYVKYVNKRYRRSGTLWEGRHKGSLVDAENYLLACYRYIEMNPVAAGIASRPDDYPWSSYRANALDEHDALITAHDLYSEMGRGVEDRFSAYRDLFNSEIAEADINQISQALSRNPPTGGRHFKLQIETALGRKIGTGFRGRPRKVDQ